ncbi:MAG: DUF4352 domain-containing protein [Actinomadura rubrobrunea]|nr:DUF4352 domain-containing protein [Actinomadura rubrobrunea]
MRLHAAAQVAAALCAALALGGVTGCSDGSRPDRAAATTYDLPPRPVREGESPLHGRKARSADLEVTALGFRDGIREILGTHASMTPKGRYVRVRILAENRGRDIQIFDTWRQLLLTADGRTHSPDVNAIMVKRQPERLPIGAGVRVELDLWYDVPGGARVTGLRIVGSPPVGAVSDPPPADIPLP